MMGVYHGINRLFFRVYRVIRLFLQVIIGLGFGVIYFYGLVFLNDGVLRIYFFLFLFLGYLFYQKYYAYYWLYVLEICACFVKKILSPFFFFFKRISVIIQKRIKKVRLRWRKENTNIKSS